MTELAFVVPGDPVPKARPRVVHGRTFTPERTRRAEQLVAAHARKAGARRLAGRVAVELRFFRATARRCDLDNLCKAIMDSLNGVAWDDDDQVVELHAEKALDRERPRTEVLVRELPAEVQLVATADQFCDAWEAAEARGQGHVREAAELGHCGTHGGYEPGRG